MVLEYYQENNEVESIEINRQNIRIDSFSFIHILFRHYAQVIKEYQAGKTYHEDLSIDYKNIPKELLRIIRTYNLLDNTNFDNQKIYFSLNGKIYAVWFRAIRRSVRGGGVIEK